MKQETWLRRERGKRHLFPFISDKKSQEDKTIGKRSEALIRLKQHKVLGKDRGERERPSDIKDRKRRGKRTAYTAVFLEVINVLISRADMDLALNPNTNTE